MMKNIYCCICKDFVGVIRDAKLKKNLSYICEDCKEKITKPKDNVDFLKDIFGMK
jgi:predicted SprT family Zn-dependent metalloprotease